MEDETGREIREEKVHTEKNNSKLLNLVKVLYHYNHKQTLQTTRNRSTDGKRQRHMLKLKQKNMQDNKKHQQ